MNAPSTRRRFDRDAAIAAMGAFVLQHGLSAASLRPLAQAANTSDRMLIYHFGTRDRLIEEVLMAVSDTVLAGLEAMPAVPPEKKEAQSDGALVNAMFNMLRMPQLAPQIALWLDVMALAARGSAVHVTVGRRIMEGYRDWLAARLSQQAGPEVVDRLAALIPGALLMDRAGMVEEATRAMESALPQA